MDELTTRLYPQQFHGRSDEDTEAFLKAFERWKAYKQYADGPTLAALPFLLKYGALRWFDTQPQNVQTVFDYLKAAFRERYFSVGRDKWKKADKLWAMQQKTGQTVDDFITEVEKSASGVTDDQENIKMIVTNGHHPAMRQFVLQKAATTIALIRQWAILAETSQQDSKTTADKQRIAHEVARIQLTYHQ